MLVSVISRIVCFCLQIRRNARALENFGPMQYIAASPRILPETRILLERGVRQETCRWYFPDVPRSSFFRLELFLIKLAAALIIPAPTVLRFTALKPHRFTNFGFAATVDGRGLENERKN